MYDERREPSCKEDWAMGRGFIGFPKGGNIE